MTRFTESVVEEAALNWLEAGGWRIAHGPDIAPDTPAAERRDYGEVVLAQRLRDALARVIDFDEPTNNDWLAVNQFSVTENGVSAQAHVSEANVERAQASGRSQNKHSRRPDVVLFVNGLPIAVLELKNAADEDATMTRRR